MTNLTRRYKIKISNDEIFAFLTETNGVEPTQWFITKNGGKNKKDVLAYIFNNTPEYIQLIAIKGKKKNCYIDKESVFTYSKTDDIESLTVARGEFYEIKIKLKNGTKYIIGAFPTGADKSHKASMKALRVEYKEVSKKEQIKNILYYVILFAIGISIGLLLSEISEAKGYNGIKHIIIAQQLKLFVENEENAESLDIVLEPYNKADLELEENYITVKHGNIKMNIPSNLYIDSEFSDSEESITYTNGLTGNSIKRVIIEYAPLDFSGFVNNDGDEKETQAYYEKISPIIEKEFGFPVTNMYQYQKAIWAADVDNINYWNYKETVIYYTLLSTKLLTAPGDCPHVYDIKTDTYSGFVLECGPTPIELYIISLWIYPNNNPDLLYTVQVISDDLDEAYKILNSVEFATK